MRDVVRALEWRGMSQEVGWCIYCLVDACQSSCAVSYIVGSEHRPALKYGVWEGPSVSCGHATRPVASISGYDTTQSRWLLGSFQNAHLCAVLHSGCSGRTEMPTCVPRGCCSDCCSPDQACEGLMNNLQHRQRKRLHTRPGAAAVHSWDQGSAQECETPAAVCASSTELVK